MNTSLPLLPSPATEPGFPTSIRDEPAPTASSKISFSGLIAQSLSQSARPRHDQPAQPAPSTEQPSPETEPDMITADKAPPQHSLIAPALSPDRIDLDDDSAASATTPQIAQEIPPPGFADQSFSHVQPSDASQPAGDSAGSQDESPAAVSQKAAGTIHSPLLARGGLLPGSAHSPVRSAALDGQAALPHLSGDSHDSGRSENRAPTAPMPSTGTASAQAKTAVHTMLEQPKTAPLQEQNLPGAFRLPEFSAASAGGNAADDSAAPPRLSALPGYVNSNLLLSPAHEEKPMAASASQELRAAQIERLGDLVARQSVLLRQTGQSSLQAVLHASSSSKLLLQLHTTAQGAEARLVCQPEDFAALQKYWPQLQESLAQQQIRLLPLKESAVASWSSMNSDSNGRQEKGRENGDEANRFAATGISDELSIPLPAGNGRRAAGWERWA